MEKIEDFEKETGMKTLKVKFDKKNKIKRWDEKNKIKRLDEKNIKLKDWMSKIKF